MSVYYDNRNRMLKLKCDCCQIAHDWIHEHGWKTIKIKKICINVCPVCREALEAEYRKSFIERADFSDE